MCNPFPNFFIKKYFSSLGRIKLFRGRGEGYRGLMGLSTTSPVLKISNFDTDKGKKEQHRHCFIGVFPATFRKNFHGKKKRKE